MIATLLASLLLALAPASSGADDVQLAAQHLRDDHPNLFHDLSSTRLAAAARISTATRPIRSCRLRVSSTRAAPASLLFQNGTRDPVSPRKDVDAYFRAASAPKERRFYDAPHELDAQDRDAWLVKLLLG